jgi:hypothetical protein
MSVTIDAVNMVEITTADTHGDFTGVNVTPSDGEENFREGTSFAAFQANQEVWDGYVSFGAVDYSNRTIFGWIKSSAPAAEGDATGAGFSMYLDDGSGGSESRSYDVGGSDNYGFFFQGWTCFRLNTAALPTGFRQVDGSLEPDLTQLTDIGMGGYFPSKAVGNAPNSGIDVIRYVAAGNPALLIEGGLTGDRGTFQEIADADAATTAAYGVCRALITGANAFEIQFGIQMGSLDADSFFEDSDFQVFLSGEVAQGGAITAGDMDIAWVGAGGQTNLANMNNFLFQGLGAVSNWDMSDTDIDELIWSDGQFVDLGTFTFQVQDAGQKTLTNLIWTNCGIVYFSSMDADSCTFNGATNPLGAVLWDENSDEQNQDNLTFVSDTTGHAIHVFPVGAGPFTFNIDGYSVSGYEADDLGSTGNTVFLVDNALDADVTINVSSGSGTFSYERAAGYTGTVTVDASVTTTLTGLQNDTEVTVYDAGDGTLIAEVEDVVGNEFAFSDAASNVVHIFIHKEDYYRADLRDFVIPGGPTDVPIQQVFDPNYQNPV